MPSCHSVIFSTKRGEVFGSSSMIEIISRSGVESNTDQIKKRGESDLLRPGWKRCRWCLGE
jgi:hypothetical protein